MVNYVLQIDTFRKKIKSNTALEQDVPLMDHWRPVQPLHGRTVYSSCQRDATLFTSPFTSPISITLAISFGLLIMFLIVR